ncbi:MAG: hypothetical protein IT355_05350 [Gemmatimonadaceae bacterium]|nr:hypothetical protein [Gemmatimonadaceae bacterium]
MSHRSVIVMAFLCITSAAAAQPSVGRADRGSVLRVDSLGEVDRGALAAFAAPLDGSIRVHGAVRMYRLVYRTVLHGRAVDASGLLVVPADRVRPRGVVLFLHGTNVTRALAPSQPDRVDGNEEAAVFGGNGYLVVLPDYLGLGESTVPQPYMIAAAQRDVSIDMLRAVRTVAGAMHTGWDPSLLLLGFSQGGHSVAAVQRELERRPLAGYRLRGAVAVAGAFALRRVSLPYTLDNNGVGYLAISVMAYCRYYGRPVSDAFAPALAQALPTLLDGNHGMDEIAPVLPEDVRALFTPAFLRQVDGREAGWFTRALDENSLDAWVPRAPLRFYNGEADTDVSRADAKRLHDFAKPRGGAVSLHSLGRVAHQESSGRMYAPVLAWFDSLSAARRAGGPRRAAGSAGSRPPAHHLRRRHG